MRFRLILPPALVFLCSVAVLTTQHESTSAEPQGPAQMCGDVNGSSSITMSDPLGLGSYCFANGAAPADSSDADCDGHEGINVGDVWWLARYIWYSGAAPACPTTDSQHVPAVAPADTLTFPADTAAAMATSAVATVLYKNTVTISAFALPMQVRVGDSIPTIDSVVWDAAMNSAFGSPRQSWDNGTGTISTGCYRVLGTPGLAPGSHTMLSIYMTLDPVPSPRPIIMDTLFLAPYNYPLFLESDMTATIPEMKYLGGPSGPAPVDDTLWIIAYSPIDLVVWDPQGDSIGIDSTAPDRAIFNSIMQDSDYDTLVDYNADNDSDDVITIPNPFAGDYRILIIREPGTPDDAKFTLAIRINGNQQMTPDDYLNASVASLSSGAISDSLVWTAETTLPGDVNADGSMTSQDIIYMVNYAFKSGPGPVVPGHADVTCDGVANSSDIIYMVIHLFKSGPSPCSQSAG